MKTEMTSSIRTIAQTDRLLAPAAISSQVIVFSTISSIKIVDAVALAQQIQLGYSTDGSRNCRIGACFSISDLRFSLNTDVVHPFTPRRSLSEVLNFMDRPFAEASATRGMVVKEKEDALHLRMDMPGLSREDVKLALEHDTLVIKGEGKTEEEEQGRKFTSRIALPEKVYKTDEIRAEMKNGVLKVVVPKIKEEERYNVRHIRVD